MGKRWAAMALAVMAAVMLLGMPVWASEDQNSGEFSQITEQVKAYLGEVFGDMDSETAGEVFEFLKEKASDGSLKTEEGIQKAIQEGEEKFDIKVNEEDLKRLTETMEKLDETVNEAVKDAVKNTAANAVKNFFLNLKNSVISFCRSLF